MEFKIQTLLLGMLFLGADIILASPCESALSSLSPIARYVRNPYAREVDRAGVLLKPGAQIPPLGDGFYIFLISSLGEVIYSPKIILSSNGAPQGLASHASLMRKYEGLTRRPIQVVAAGQFSSQFGEITRIDNRSGNFRGSSDRLKLAVDLLVTYGLPINSDSEQYVWDSNDRNGDGHTPEGRSYDTYQLELYEQYLKSTRSIKVYDLYRELTNLIRELEPELSLHEIARALAERNRSVNVSVEAAFLDPFMLAYTPDGFLYGIQELSNKIESRKISPFRDFKYTGPVAIYGYLNSRKNELTSRQRGQLRRIAKAFKNIDD